MVLNVKFDVEPEGFASAAEIANTWRVGRDIRPVTQPYTDRCFSAVARPSFAIVRLFKEVCWEQVWSDVVRLADIVEPLAHLSHPGGFSDLDSLEVGVAAPILVDAESGQPSNRCSNFCPSSGVLSGACVPAVPPRNVTMSLDEQRSQMALWCMTNSMLIAGNDLRTMSAETRDILVAKGPLSVLKDPLTVGARRMRLEPAGLFETWARPLHGGAFAALLWSRNESCLANDDSHVHLDPTPQIFWRSLGFRGSAEVVDLWTGESLGVHADHWPPSYSSPLKWGLRPHAHRLVKVLPRPDAEWTSEVGEARQWKCPAWGCQVQDTVLRQFAQRVSLKTEDEETAADDPWQKICEAEYAGRCPAGWDWLTKPDKSRGCADPPCCAPTPAHPKNSKCTTIQGMTASWKNHGQTGLKAKQAWEAYCGIFWPTPSCPSGWTSDSGNNRCEPPAKHPSDCKMITGVQGYDYFKKEAWQQTCTGEHWVCPNPGAKPPPHPHPSPGPPKPPANPNTDARKVFIVFGNHLDVGYASFSVDIINRYMNEFFPRAIATAAQFRANYPNGSRGYTWLGFSFILEFLHNCQSASSASKYFDQVKLQCPNATVTAGIEAAIRAGPTHGLSWHASKSSERQGTDGAQHRI